MKSSLKWILKKQLGWIVGADFILIYTNAFAQTYTDLATPYKYVVPGTEVVNPGSEPAPANTSRKITFKPAPKADQPSQMAVAHQLAVAQIQADQEQVQKKAADQVPAQAQIIAKPSKPTQALKTAPAAKPSASSPEQETVSSKEPEFLGSPVWGRSSERDKWSRAVLEVVRANKRTLDRAKDVETFCPGYRKATTRAQEMCWLIIMSAISKKESDFKPGTTLTEDNGDVSVGLLAMSGHQCRNAPTIRALKNPVENVKCGTRLMAKLVVRDGYISRGRGGGGANWSVVRSPYWATFRGRRIKLGKLPELLVMSKPKFKAVLRESAKHQEKVRLANLAEQQASALAKIQEETQAENIDTSSRAATGIQ